jgi:hypothetical protein
VLGDLKVFHIIDMDLKATGNGSVGGVELTQDRPQRQTVLKTVMDLRAPFNKNTFYSLSSV